MATPSSQQRRQRRPQVIGFRNTRRTVSLSPPGIEDKCRGQRQNRKASRGGWIGVHVDFHVRHVAKAITDLVDHPAHLRARRTPRRAEMHDGWPVSRQAQVAGVHFACRCAIGRPDLTGTPVPQPPAPRSLKSPAPLLPIAAPCIVAGANHAWLNPSRVMVNPVVMPSMMTSEPRAPWLVGATPNGSLWSGSWPANAASTASRLSSGTFWLAVFGPVSTPVGVNTSVVLSSPAIERSTETLTSLSKWADFGVPVNTRPWLPEIPDSVVPPLALLVSCGGASTIRSRIPM